MPSRSSGPYNALEVTDLGSCIDKFCSVHLSMTARLGPEAAKVCPLRKYSCCAQGSEGCFPFPLTHTVHDHKQPTRFLCRALQQARTVESDRIVPEDFSFAVV